MDPLNKISNSDTTWDKKISFSPESNLKIGNWDINKDDIKIITELSKDNDNFNAKYGVFRIGYYNQGSSATRVFIKGYNKNGLNIETGLNEIAAYALMDELDVHIPNHVIDLDEKKAWQEEVIGTQFTQLKDHQYDRISKEQYLQFACLFPIVAADDFRPPNIFLRADGEIVTIDLDSAMADLTEVGEFYPEDDRKFRRTVQRILEYSEPFDFELTEDEILAKIQETSEYIMDNKAEQFRTILRTYRNEQLTEDIMRQIRDFSNGDFDEYNSKGGSETKSLLYKIAKRMIYTIKSKF